MSRGMTWLVGAARGLRIEVPCAWVRCDAAWCEGIVTAPDTIREDAAADFAAAEGWTLGSERDVCEVHS